MKWVRVLACLAVLPVAQAAAQTPSSSASDDLEGLWKATRRFGPDARGSLIIRRTDTAYVADMVGRVVPIRAENGELSFDLPDEQGSFRGKLQEGAILGHWFPPRGMAQNAGGIFASPVRLQPDGPNRWSGAVVPWEDAFTFYLLVQKRQDGTLGAVLRNPERDFGGWLGVDRLVRDGNAVKLIGKRPGWKEERELASGRYEAASELITLSFPTRGGTYDFRREGDDSDFYPRGKNPARYEYRPPPVRDDGWPTGTLDEADIDRAAIEKLIQKLIDEPMETMDALEIHGLLIARHGRLVLEEYFHGQHRDRTHETRSAAKSVTATLVGAAIQAGAPLALSTPVYQVMNGGAFPADLEPRKQAMTLEHLLTMSSGYFCDDTDPEAPGNEETMNEQQGEPDYYRFTLNVPMASAPGEKAVYCSSNPNLALGAVGRAAGEFPLYTFDRLLGVPMKIDHYGWPLDPAGNPYGGGAVQFRPRDFMKFGQLMLDGGTWQGQRILGRDFVARASAPLYHLRGITYGYLWWGIDYPYKDRTVHAFFAVGAGGQSVMVVPELDLVIATFAGDYSSRTSMGNMPQNLPPRYILPAVREPGDDKGAPVVFREDYVTPYGRSEVTGPVTGTK